jgi:hypothetical protein
VATARERLLQALSAIISQPFSDDGRVALIRLLNSYRVQAKPGENIENNHTARDALAHKIIAAWMHSFPTEKKILSQIISAFRMQLKQGLGRGKLSDTKKMQDHIDIADHTKGLTRLQIKQNTSKHENAYFKDKHIQGQPDAAHKAIAGGPKQGSNSRGKCPKCRSMGIVLARAYGGDDYHSCIYCGYQAYLKDGDAKLDLPLAAELLGHAFGDPDVE